ncbi:MAG TPA: hypothetical protein VMX17_07885 [Candidatus Glassbacteria bacterium]|nr:hypothetical protein [Candidatus Glassbacteria bacterium]
MKNWELRKAQNEKCGINKNGYFWLGCGCVEGGDSPNHCKQCGSHCDNSWCDRCEIETYEDEMERTTKAFDGNSEAAVRYLEHPFGK